MKIPEHYICDQCGKFMYTCRDRDLWDKEHFCSMKCEKENNKESSKN